jgi:hypothetical protein
MDWKMQLKKATPDTFGSNEVSVALHWAHKLQPEIVQIPARDLEKYVADIIARHGIKLRLIKIGITDIYRPPAQTPFTRR